MRKFLFLLMWSVLFCNLAYAGCDCKHCYEKMTNFGGFVDVDEKPIALAEVKKMHDDARVVIEGHITKQLSDDEYNFSDGADNIVVEIDKKYWRGLTVTPKDKVIIHGEVDKDFTKFKVEAKSIELVK